MENCNINPEASLGNNGVSLVECSERGTEVSISGNAAAKRELAGELIAQGITEEAVCRILHICAAELPEDDSF